MWHAQEHYNSYTQPLINLVSAHILGRVRFCLKFYIILCIFFYKIKTKEHPNLHDTTFLVLFRVYVGENSRTFQDLNMEFKDFSRIYSKIQELSRLCKPCCNILRSFHLFDRCNLVWIGAYSLSAETMAPELQFFP